MTVKRFAITLLLSILSLPLALRVQADQAPCVTVSAGAETDTMTGSLQNAGQSAIGTADNGAVFMHAGGIACLTLVPDVPCLLGDVNDDGVIDGLDIQLYTDVTITGIGTPQELCAADIDVSGFAALLLAQ